GEMFVHRNIANLVVHTDFNCLSVLEYAVEILHVKHIIVCGHYGCGGVHAALENTQRGLIDNWLRHIKDIYEQHRSTIDALPSLVERENLLCELNVVAQVKHVSQTTIVQNAWQRGHALQVHGWLYSLRDGLVYELDDDVESDGEVDSKYRMKRPVVL
ncbi:MAG: carbonic anhydrase, partial [bacterium]|nr:carbonic anhydrase [Candidatus Kapabacteria bacterium]